VRNKVSGIKKAHSAMEVNAQFEALKSIFSADNGKGRMIRPLPCAVG
jgi:hypothetical protein